MANDLDPARRARLNAIKLRTLVRGHLGSDVVGEAPAEPGRATPTRGAAMLVDGQAWVLVEEGAGRGLGGALAWALRQGATSLNVVASEGTGVIARRAEFFEFPVRVFHADGRSLLPAIAQQRPVPPEPPADVQRWRDVIARAGATPRLEFGELVGEVRGLEVCRVVVDPLSGESRLEVGVGIHDREAFAIMHGDQPTAQSLARVVAAVAVHRRAGADPHPLNRLAAERRLRCDLIDRPEGVGAVSLEEVDPPEPRPNLRDRVPCVATGTSTSGEPLVVVVSSGIDLELVPFAADARAALSGSSRAPELVVATPRRDAAPITAAMGEALRVSARFVGLEDGL